MFFFCDNFHYKLDEHVKKQIENKLQTDFYCTHEKPVDLNLSKLNANCLITIDKKNKINAILFLIIINNNKYSIFIINNVLYNVKLKFENELYNGTLFEGHLVYKNRWFYFITDVKYYIAQNVRANSLIWRVQTIYRSLKKRKIEKNTEPCDIQINSFFLYNHVKLIKKNCTLIFKSHLSEFSFEFIVEKKPFFSISDIVLFDVHKTPKKDVYKLYNNVFIGVLTVTSMEMSNKLRNMFAVAETLLLKCKYNKYFKNWILSEEHYI